MLWVLCPNADGSVKSVLEIGTESGHFRGELDAFDLLAYGLAALGDADHDRRPEFAAGAPGDDDGGEARGAVWLVGFDRHRWPAPKGGITTETLIR